MDITDFLAFKANYGSTTASYDIAPATIGTGTYADIYSKCTPDGSVGLLDFLVFGRNYGKSISVATVTAVTLSGATTVTVGSTIDITAKVTYSDGTTKSEVVEWSTSDETVATETANGEWTRVTGIKEGTVTIKAAINGKVGEITVNVLSGNQTVQSVEVTGGNGVAIGGTLQLTATSLLSTGETETTGATWSSTNTAVATVDSTGKVTGVSAGTTKIKAIRAGVSHEITVVVAAAVNGVKVHAKGYKTIYAWEGTNTVLAGAWPGTALSTTGETGTWGSYYFEGKDGINIIFIDASGNKTGDLTGVKKGEHWYLDGKWYDYNAEQDFIAPEITATPEAGNQEPSSVEVVLTAKDTVDTAAKIYYTTNGAMPTTSSTLYSGKITVAKDTVIKAIAVDASSNVSKVYLFSYKLNQDITPPVITATPAAGKYETAQSVKITAKDNKDSSVNIYYTIDGSTPKAELSYMYNGQTINVASTTTIKALSVDKAGNKAEESLRYTIGTTTSSGDFREETIYFAITTRFYDGYSKNNYNCWDEASWFNNPATDPSWRGDFGGLVKKLDYIKALGFSAIWITPPVKNASGIDYHGYHAVDFSEIDPRYDENGDGKGEDEYQNFIDACHAKGIKVIQDIVINHSGNFGEENLFPLFKMDSTLGSNGGYIGLDVPKNLVANDYLAKVAKTDYATMLGAAQYGARINAMKEDANDTQKIYHHEKSMSYESYTEQIGQMAGDCVDLNTENPIVQDYLEKAYDKYINMGVDAFRIDTVKHVSRLDFNKAFIPHWKKTGGDNFYMFGEICTRVREVWNKGIAADSAPFYTWKESKEYPWGDEATNTASVKQLWADNSSVMGQPESTNAFLTGNTYHAPDYSKNSGLAPIDFAMHWNFYDARNSFGVAVGQDKYYNDASWNVVYVDSHDYAPDECQKFRYNAGTDAWAENLSLMFTFRGIPCVYYGSEIEFQKGLPIDPSDGDFRVPFSKSGRAYYGDNLEGTVTASDYGVYTASGTVATTLSQPLCKHIRTLNKIRREIPALQKGQYSVEGVSGSGMAFKRRYTKGSEDSMALVVISGSATFSGVPSGKWVDVVTGDTQSGTTVTANATGKGNIRVYVLGGSQIKGLESTFIK